jgi:sister-chromatid-cohesion protein PDS5
MASKATMNLFNVNIVGLCSRKNDLLQHLNALHKALRVLTQEDSVSLHKVLKSTTAPQLISPKLLSHNDKEVKLLCACCIVDTFRLLAPDNPYNNEDTITAFNLVVNQLRGLATFAPVTEILGSHVYYILNNIATVQSCVVPVLLAMDGVFGADEVAVSMFSAILSSLRVDHPTQGNAEFLNNV